MTEKYGPAAQATLFVLMRERRDITNPELANDYKIKLTKPEREALAAAGLLEIGKRGQAMLFHLTPAGVDWCEGGLAVVEPPERSGPLIRVVFAIIRDRAGQPGLESLIRGAYHDLATKPQDWVRLAALRQQLTAAVDRTLLDMTRTTLVHLAPQSNRRALTDADVAAAITVAGDDNHLVAIEES